METEGKCVAEIRRRKPDSRNSESQEWSFAGRSRFQIPHCGKLQKPEPGVSDSFNPQIMRNARNGEDAKLPVRSERQQTKSDHLNSS